MQLEEEAYYYVLIEANNLYMSSDKDCKESVVENNQTKTVSCYLRHKGLPLKQDQVWS